MIVKENVKIILASSSPRRREFLKDLGLRFKMITPSVEEVYREGESPEDYVARNAETKLIDVFNAHRHEPRPCLFIAADTIVVLKGKILEKPKDANDAKVMLKSMSGCMHEVYTGLSVIYSPDENTLDRNTMTVRTEVVIKNLSDEEISNYIETGESLDKAGAYAIQGKGAYMVKSIKGSYSNVVGLPLCELYDMLQGLGATR